MSVSTVSGHNANPNLPEIGADELRADLLAKLQRPHERSQAQGALIEYWITGKLELWKDLRLAKTIANELLSEHPRAKALLEKVEEEEENQLMRRC